MITKFCVFDRNESKNYFFETKEEAINYYTDMLIMYAKSNFGNSIYTKVDYHDDGSEVWISDQNDIIEVIHKQMVTEKLQTTLSKESLFKVEVL